MKTYDETSVELVEIDCRLPAGYEEDDKLVGATSTDLCILPAEPRLDR